MFAGGDRKMRTSRSKWVFAAVVATSLCLLGVWVPLASAEPEAATPTATPGSPPATTAPLVFTTTTQPGQPGIDAPPTTGSTEPPEPELSTTTTSSTLPLGPSPETLQRRRELEALAGKISEKQYQVYKATIELDEIDRVLAVTVEDYNLHALQVEEATTESEGLRRELSAVREDLAAAIRALEERVVGTYKSDSTALDLLLTPNDLSDFVRRVGLLISIARRDRDRVGEITSLQARSDRLLDELSRQIYDVTTAARLLEERKAQIQAKLDERQSYLDQLSAEVRTLVDEQRRLALDVVPIGFDVGDFMVGDTSAILKTALGYLGVPYVWGGATPNGFDCSGLVQYVFLQHGLHLPHYSRYQAQMGFEIPPADIEPADLVFFGDPVYHVGIYLGDGLFVHAPRTGDVVKISALASRSDLSHVRRVAILEPVEGLPQGP